MTTDAHRIQHRPPHAWALDDARDHLRRAMSAISAASVPDQQQASELARMHSRLADELVALQTLGQPL